MKKFMALLLFLLVSCNCAYALTDSEYKKFMKDPNFAKADKELNRAWKEAQQIVAKSKAALEKLKSVQREWVQTLRDKEAEALADMYSRIRAYTIVTRNRAEDLPGIAHTILETYPESSSSSSSSSSSKKRSQSSTKTQTKYPLIGICTGDGVRIRSNPNTKSEILNSAETGQTLILLNERKVNGDLWYEIDNPSDEGTGWIFGKYINIFKPEAYGTPAYTLAVLIRKDFGLSPERSKSILGEPRKIVNDTFYWESADEEIEQLIYEYNGFKLQYIENRLRHVEVSKPGIYFGELELGSYEQIVVDTLGRPSGEGDEGITYNISPTETIQFEFQDRQVTWMGWDEYLDN